MSSVFPVPPRWSPEMATILTFDPTRRRKLDPSESASIETTTTAEILIFTGVRREPLSSTGDISGAARHAPMFDDTAPEKPNGKKRRRSKTR